MTTTVPADEIERAVGVRRRGYHVARAVSAEQQVYILHSRACRGLHDRGLRDVRNCPWSRALDRGINERDWSGMEDVPVVVDIDHHGDLVPTGRVLTQEVRP